MMIDLTERLRGASLSLPGSRECGLPGNVCDEAADAIERLTAERDSARRDGMSAAASILEAEHERSSGAINEAAYYARIIREAIGR